MRDLMGEYGSSILALLGTIISGLLTAIFSLAKKYWAIYEDRVDQAVETLATHRESLDDQMSSLREVMRLNREAGAHEHNELRNDFKDLAISVVAQGIKLDNTMTVVTKLETSITQMNDGRRKAAAFK